VNEKAASCDVCVCGGGLAGVCAALASARQGAQTVLIQNRPVLGGNSSSEIRVPPCGAASFHAYARETGIISELCIEERARNHAPLGYLNANSVWDLTLYDAVIRQPGLTLHLNTNVDGVAMAGARLIEAVQATVLNAETRLSVSARTFIDCTGDGIVAHLAGCAWRMGSESRAEFNEPHAPRCASDGVMGSTLLFRTRDIGQPAPYHAPDWAVRYEDASFFKSHGRSLQPRGGFWWIELSNPWHTITDAEDIRHELTRHVLGIWDYIKNRDPQLLESAKNHALEWIGQVPGKRESRRVIGRHLMTEVDLAYGVEFPDEVAFGGWYVDLHPPGGLLADEGDHDHFSANTQFEQRSRAIVGPYGIPLRALIARDVDNLLLAGRNISVSHAVLGSTRLMQTCALLGQAAGTAAAVALQKGISLPESPQLIIGEIQQSLLRTGCFLPHTANHDPQDKARSARVSASSQTLSRGAAMEDSWVNPGLNHRFFKAAANDHDGLDTRRGQYIACSGGHISAISLGLGNSSGVPQEVTAVVLEVDSIWDYRLEPYPALSTARLTVSPGDFHWVKWEVNIEAPYQRYLRLDLLPNPGVAWHTAGALLPGQVAATEMDGRMRCFKDGVTLCFDIDPAQVCYAPGNVLSGVTRPHRWTNLWRSDPSQPLPQWIELAWDSPQQVSRVELTFPGHLLREYEAYAPFYRDAQCPRDYAITAWDGIKWVELIQVEGNYQRQRQHDFPPVDISRLRLTVSATNGDPSAGVYEIRAY
jgi:hypothetical protein